MGEMVMVNFANDNGGYGDAKPGIWSEIRKNKKIKPLKADGMSFAEMYQSEIGKFSDENGWKLDQCEDELTDSFKSYLSEKDNVTYDNGEDE